MNNVGSICNGKKLGYKGHSGLYTYDACPNCGKERWVRKHLVGHLCRACSNALNNSKDEANQKKRDKLTGKKRDWSPSKEHIERIRQAIAGKKCTPEHIEKVRQASLRQWRNPITRERLITSLLEMRAPNKQETIMLEFLNSNFGNEWKYVGNGEFIIGGLCPDFINTNGKKLIVEYFGEYWHKPQDEKFRSKIFAQFGYKTLVIWSSELPNKEELIAKVDTWLKGG